jgi:hypothetical protein
MAYVRIQRLVVIPMSTALLVACSGGGSGPTIGAATAPPSPGAATAGVATAAATSEATASASDQPTAAATPAGTDAATPAAATAGATTGATGELASVMPAEVGGIAGEINGYTGPEYVELASGGNADTKQLLEDQFGDFGVTTEDVSAATGDYYSDETYVRISALRLAGVDVATFMDQYVQNIIDSTPEFNSAMEATAEDATMGTKPVTKITTTYAGSVYDTQYLYVMGDTLFTVTGGSDELIEEALSLLP